MYVSIELPDINEYPNGFPEYWLNCIFNGPISTDYRVNSLVSTYVRLVEASLIEYRLAHVRLGEFWKTHDSINIGAMNKAISHFEACILNMHRAIRCFVRLRRSPYAPQELKDLLRKDKPSFVADKITDRLANVRDAIHHFDEMILKEEFPEGAPIALKPDGPESLIADENGQSLKIIDRLMIGKMEITFSELAEWLVEMSHYTEIICRYKPRVAL